jgi:pimeloyl-ACP methyl ester carboxylesterase
LNNAILNCREFSVEVMGQPLACLLAEPKELSNRPALLLNFAADRTTTLQSEPYSITPRMFLDAGHRVASFDLPCHGDREVSGEPRGIAGFCAEWRRGNDVFAGLVDEGRAVIDALIERKLGEPGRIFVSGTSRGGYCALRLMAADERIKAAAAFSPVTDWRVLREFAEVKEASEIADLALPRFAGALAGRAVWTAIGNCDARVGTDACLRFAEAVLRAEAEEGRSSSHFVLHVIPERNHQLSDSWRRRGGEYLLDQASG